mgnify:CR=1 FL=1
MSKEQSKALFYTQGVEEVLKSLDTSIDGLSTAQAKERLDAYGYNELDEGEKRSLLSKFIDQFKDLMIIILLVAAALSIITEGRHIKRGKQKRLLKLLKTCQVQWLVCAVMVM